MHNTARLGRVLVCNDSSSGSYTYWQTAKSRMHYHQPIQALGTTIKLFGNGEAMARHSLWSTLVPYFMYWLDQRFRLDRSVPLIAVITRKMIRGNMRRKVNGIVASA